MASGAVIEHDQVDYGVPPEELEVRITRRTLARVYLAGAGVEVGAGTRPWPLPPGATCFYGDVLDAEALVRYFGASGSPEGAHLDAQTMAGIADGSFDFALSAHVLEHLVDPLGSVREQIRVLRPGGILMFAIPDKRFTWDNPRPVTPFAHLLSDYRTGGEDTRAEGCLEHIRYLHPQWAEPLPSEMHEAEARRLAEARFDTHYHTWTGDTFGEMLRWVEAEFGATLLHREFVVNENIAVFRTA